MEARNVLRSGFEPAYRQPEWMGTEGKFDNGTVAIEGLGSPGRAENPGLSPALPRETAPPNAAAALLRAEYEDVARTWSVARSKEEGLG